ncbi:MAG: SulP family inorganic anion transporter [Magnetococcales bacterium]|nr:SulP family inorganic anion transporter [Magnetococcales bacterium]
MANWWKNWYAWRLHNLTRQGKNSFLWQEVRLDFSWREGVVWRSENLAGVLGALLVIPQAVSFAWLVGLSPEYGLYTAIWGTLLAAILGGSTIVGGPNTAVAILLGVTVSSYAGRGSPLYLELVLLLSAMTGILQLMIWLARGGRLFQYFSPTAILAMTTGVGILIVASSLSGITGIVGLESRRLFEQIYLTLVAMADGLANPYSLILGLVTALLGWLAGKRWGPRWQLLAAMGGGWLLAALLHLVLPQSVSEMEMVGSLPMAWLPLTVLPTTWDHLLMAMEMIPAAISIALVGLAQTMVIGKGINLSNRERINLHRETFAQGASNLLTVFFSCFAGSGSFNRTAAGHQMNAMTPWPAILSSLLIFLFMPLLGGWFVTVPMPVMAGVLLLVGVVMVKPQEIHRLWQLPGEMLVFILVLSSVLILGLERGILIAAATSVIPFLLGAAVLQGRMVQMSGGVSLELNGNLFFASLDPLANHLKSCSTQPLIINLRQVSYLDYSGVDSLLQEARRRDKLNLPMVVYVHTSAQQRILEQADRSGILYLVSSLPEARQVLLDKACQAEVRFSNQAI